MSLPSDLDADVAAAAPHARPAPRGTGTPLARVSNEQLGLAAAVLIAFVGVVVIAPQVRAMRRAAGEAGRRGLEAAERQRARLKQTRREAEAQLRSLGDKLSRSR